MPASNTSVQLTYQVCPIILSGGIATNVPGGYLSLLNLFYGPDVNALGLPFNIGDLDNAFGAFNVLPGGTLVSQTIAKYPFANQFVAANATIREPLTLSVIMDSPMRTPQAFTVKQAIMTALKGTLDIHNNLGGTFVVKTPAYMYTNLIMTSLTDNSRGNNSLPQNAWRFDFEKPLVSLEDLSGAQNLLMSKLSNGTRTDGSQTGIQVGTQTVQIPFAIDPNTGYGTPLYGGDPVPYLTQNQLNYPALPSAQTGSFAGVY